jgi:hypothetical protein
VAALRGAKDTALVIPDSLDHLAQAAIRRAAGPVWLVPSPVAAALALDALAAPAPHEAWLVVVRTAAALDIAVLERVCDPNMPDEPVWIRSAPAHDGRGGRLEGLDPLSLGAALRGDRAGEGVVIQNDVLVDIPAESSGRRSGPVAVAVEGARSRWRGQPISRALLVGLVAAEVDSVGALLGAPTQTLEPRALSVGGWHFLDRHRRGLPTWKDRLPRVDLQVKKDKMRVDLPLIEEGRLVAPGDLIFTDYDRLLTLYAGQERIRFPMNVQGAPSGADLSVSGPPLPLGKDVQVRVQVSYTHGRQGLTATLVPNGDAPFSRLAFELVASAGLDQTGGGMNAAPGAAIPEIPSPRAPTEAEQQALREAVSALSIWWSRLDRKRSKNAENQAGVLGKELEERLNDLRLKAKSTIRGTTTEAMPPELRAWLCDAALPWLAWLGGRRCDPPAEGGGRRDRKKGGVAGPSGKAPKLTQGELSALLQARAALRIAPQEDGLLDRIFDAQSWRAEVDRRLALGALVDGRPDRAWTALLGTAVGTLSEEGAVGEAVASALEGDPALGEHLQAAEVEALLMRLADAIARAAALTPPEAVKLKRPVYRVLRAIELLVSLRRYGLVPTDSPAVASTFAALSDARLRLPDEVRQFAERSASTQQDEQLGRTIDALAGRYGDVAASE